MEAQIRSGSQVIDKNCIAKPGDSKKETESSRFVVLRHDVGSQMPRAAQTHFDWMFESGDHLRTFATLPLDRFDESCEGSSDLLSDHRLAYLEYEGEIAGDRGRVVRILSGRYRSTMDREDQFVAELQWQQDGAAREAFVEFYRNFSVSGLRRDDNRGGWRFRFSPGRYETKR